MAAPGLFSTVVVGQRNWRLLECSCVLESISDAGVCKDDIKF